MKPTPTMNLETEAVEPEPLDELRVAKEHLNEATRQNREVLERLRGTRAAKRAAREELRRVVLSARAAGATYRRMGEAMGVSASRARDMVRLARDGVKR